MTRATTKTSWYDACMHILARLIRNLRFYILMSALLGSAIILAFTRMNIESDQLFYIRSQQIFGFTSAILVYIAVILTPVSKLVGKKDWMSNMLFARRAVGVSAAYFAGLHIYIALFKQTGGLAGLSLLPDRFQQSFLFGFIAFFILFLMASTSMDWVIDKMTFRRWKILHRFVYLAGVLIILHVWMIGTHITQDWFKYTTFAALILLFALESIRIGRKLVTKYKLAKESTPLVIGLLFISMTGLLAAVPRLTSNYHSQHHEDHGSAEHQE